MRFDREPWIKLYRHEGPQHRLMSIEARAFRDFLLRFAQSESGVLLEQSRDPFRDLCRVIAADSSSTKKVKVWCQELIDVGYLDVNTNGKITIKRFVEAQEARSPGAKRNAKYRENKQSKERDGDVDDASHETSHGDTSETSQCDEHNASHETSPKKRRDEMRRDEMASPSRGDVPDIRSRCERLVNNPYDASFEQPQTWPEIVQAAEILHTGLGFTGKPKLGRFASDKGLKRIVELFAAGFSVNDLIEAQPKIKTHEFLAKVPKLSVISVDIMREILESSASSTRPEEDAPWTN